MGEHGTLLCFLDSEDVARFLFPPKSYFQTLVVGAGTSAAHDFSIAECRCGPQWVRSSFNTAAER